MARPRDEEPEYVEVEGELLRQTDSAYYIGYGNKQAWVSMSMCKDVELLDNGPGRNKTIRCLMVGRVAEKEELI